MAIPSAWSLVSGTSSYKNETFTINNVKYQITVNSQTGAADLYKQSRNTIIASTDSGNNWKLTNVDEFLTTVQPGTVTKSNAAEYFAKNFSLPLNQYRATLINGVSTNTSTFTNMPGVNSTPLNGSQTTTPIQTATPPSQNALIPTFSLPNPADLIDVATDPLGAADEISGTFGGNEKELFSRFLLKYPIDLLDRRQDTLSISQFRYKAPQNDIYKTGNFDTIIKDGLTRGIDYQKDTLGTVVLPMPNRVSDSNNVSWGADNMSALNAAVSSDIASRLPEYGAAFLGGQLASALRVNGSQAVSAMVLYKILQNFGDPNVKTSAGAGLVSTIAGAAGYEVPAESILSRGFGIVPNSNLELLFSGPSLRQFAFAYRLSPRSKTEALAIRNILRFFKQGMSARKSSSGDSFFLGTPNIFRLQYKYDGNNEIKGVNKIKTCALTGFSVDYSPDGMWSSYEEGQPASVTINMAFAELEPIYNTDYSTDNGITNDSVGF
jgi:hypothetical protein